MLRGYPGITRQSALNARLRCPSTLSGAGARHVPSVAAPPSFDMRPGQQCMRCHVGRQAAEVARLWSLHEGLHVATQVPSSWLGRQLHANGGGDLAGVGMTVALLVRLARALPGGPARVFPWRVGVPGMDLSGCLVGFFGEDGCLPILI